MLRRSTGLSEEMKRVGMSRENIWVSGPGKCRWVAIARLLVPVSVGVDDVVAIGGLLDAMERLRLVSGSAVSVAMHTGFCMDT